MAQEKRPLLADAQLPTQGAPRAPPEQFESAFHVTPVHLLDQIEPYWKASAPAVVVHKAAGRTSVAGARVPVNATLSIVNLKEISPLTSSFEAKIKIYLQWEIKMDEGSLSKWAEQADQEPEGYHSLDPDEFEEFQDLVNLPSVGFFNEMSREEADMVGLRVYRRRSGDVLNTVMWYQAFNFKFTQTFHLKDFPYDTQELKMVFELNNWKTWKKFDLTVVAICVHRDAASVSQFDIAYPTIHKEAAGSVIEHRRRTVCLKIARQWQYYMHNIVLVFIMLSFVALMSFAVDVDEVADRLSLLVTVFLTVVAFKFTLELPKLSYVTTLDAYMLQMMGQLFVCSIMMCVPSVLHELSQNDELSLRWKWLEEKQGRKWLDHRIAIFMLVLSCIVHVRFVFQAFMQKKHEVVKHVDGKAWLCCHYARPYFLPDLP